MTAEAPDVKKPADVIEAAPPQPTWSAALRNLGLGALAALALLGAFALDRAGDARQVFCQSPADANCIAVTPTPGESWQVSLRRYAAQSDGGVHACVVIAKLLLYLAFALSTLELLLQLLQTLGVPALTLKSIRETFGDIKKPDATAAPGLDEKAPARLLNVFISFSREVVTHPQILVTTVALLGVGGAVVHQVTNNHGLTADDAARIMRIEAQVQTMRSTLVSAGGDELPPTPVAPPALAITVAALREAVDQSSGETSSIRAALPALDVHRELGELLATMNGVDRNQKEFGKKLLPVDLRPELARLTRRIDGLGGQIRTVDGHLCGSNVACVDVPELLARASQRSEQKLLELDVKISSASHDAAETLRVSNATRQAIGFVSPLPKVRPGEPTETIGGGIARILNLEHEWAKSYFRLVSSDNIRKVLEKEPDILASCRPPQQCSLGVVRTANELGAATAPAPDLTTRNSRTAAGELP